MPPGRSAQESNEMTKLDRVRRAAVGLAAVIAAVPAAAQQVATPTAAKAVDEKAFQPDEPGFYADADLSYVLTAGNSSSKTLGFKGDLTERWGRHSVGFAAGAIRASASAAGARYAIGTPDDFDLVVPEAQPTAASYYGRGRYHYKLSDRLFYASGLGWERNRFSGVDSRWVGDTGAGYIFLNDARTSFRASAGVTWTHERDTIEDGRKTSFVGARLGWDFQQKLFESTTFSHTLVADENLERTDDLRVDAQFGLQVAMTKGLGLKVNWRLLWDNQPALAEVPLVGPGGVPTGLTVVAPYKELDQGFSVSLVFTVAPKKKS
jgi:putative salt-induced outer membrane protein YdiY